MMKKSEFLDHLANATHLITTDESGAPRSDLATRYLRELGVFSKDPRFDDPNPITRAVVRFSRETASSPSPLKDMQVVEDAWEFFQEIPKK